MDKIRKIDFPNKTRIFIDPITIHVIVYVTKERKVEKERQSRGNVISATPNFIN